MKTSPLLLRILRRQLNKERRGVRKRWDRSLPTGEYFNDRWHRAKSLGFGEGTSVYDSTVIIGKVSVGSRTWIGPFVLLDGSGGLRIGDNCSVSAGAQVYTHDTVKWAISGGIQAVERRSTVIGSNVYIGPNVVIVMGVQIGDGAVIGANSFVDSDIPANRRAWGNPCRLQPE